MISYGKQYLDLKDKKFVNDSLSNSLITTGPYVDKFEKELKKYVKSKYLYTCSSGTAAIHLALLALNLKKGDTIIMPAVNFISSYNLAKTLQLKVFLADVDKNSGQMKPENVIDCIKKNKLLNIAALIVMYHGGYPQYIKKFYDLKRKYKFYIIEDACHALGSEYKYRKKFYKVGSCKHSDICTFSLHPLKTITSGEGGVITTKNNQAAKRIKLFRSHGILRSKKKYWKYDVVQNGLNYRLSDINCALGLSQLKKINFFLKSRKLIYNMYQKEFKNFNSNLLVPSYSNSIKPSYHLFIININFDKLKKNKDHFLKYLKFHKIFAQFHYIPIYKFYVFKEKKIKYPGAEEYYANAISMPIYVSLSKLQLEKIIKITKKYFKEFSKF